MRFHIRTPNEGALKQIVQLLAKHRFKDAELLLRLVTVPQATWLTGGDPADVTKQVREVLLRGEAPAPDSRLRPVQHPGPRLQRLLLWRRADDSGVHHVDQRDHRRDR